MISLLIYGIGNDYAKLKNILNWNQIHVAAFLETVVSRTWFEGAPVYSPEEAISGGVNFDYVVCASVYEPEMRKNLRTLQVPEEKIVSGKMELCNLLKYLSIFDVSKIVAFENELILKKMQEAFNERQEILENVKMLMSRNRYYDLSRGISWAKNLSIVAGGMAVSYDYLYVMLRILSARRPQSILELGMGQSSKILAGYQKEANCSYDIVEQDKEWYVFIKDEIMFSDRVNIHIKPMKTIYNKRYGTEVNCYTDFDSIIRGKKYDFISIDGPWGSGGVSRGDILPHIPQCLENSFSIMLDDYGRIGEKNMIKELEQLLQDSHIKYHKKVYGTDKEFVLITSEDNYFLCTLY